MKRLKKFIYLLTAICCVSFSLCSHTASQADTSVTYLALGDSISTGYKPATLPQNVSHTRSLLSMICLWSAKPWMAILPPASCPSCKAKHWMRLSGLPV